jgi:diaminopimelate decarboxylase
MDVVSGGELARALAAGVSGEAIVYSGVGKTAGEIGAALDAGAFCLNIESESELALVAEVARARGTTAPIALRVNPDVDAQTHAKITTGRAENKFGIAFDDAVALYSHAGGLDGVEVTGVAMHIGSQITSLAPFEAAFKRMVGLVGDLRAQGQSISHVDLGGGLGIPYQEGEQPPHPDDYAAMVRRVFAGIGATLILEPGRLIAGNAGILVARVLHVKTGATKSFLIVDAAMNDLIRPTLYDAFHEVLPGREAVDGARRRYDVVGPVCETGDYLALDRELPELAGGDLVAFATAGAYGAVQSGTYNTRPLVAEVLVSGHDFAVVRPRQTIDQLIGLDRVAPWLAKPAPRRSGLSTM